jgi:uncharacterized protein
MKILALADISDLHWKHGIGQAELIISCGDVADQVILEAARAYGCEAIFAVKGNHDFDMPFVRPILDLHLKVRKYAGLKFSGLNGSWKYKPNGPFLYDQWEVDGFLEMFPHVDFFVTHNAPKGIHDQQDDVHQGFNGLTSYILRAAPKLVIHGHQHLHKVSKFGRTRIVGVYERKLIEI